VTAEIATQYVISTLNLAGLMALTAIIFASAAKLVSKNIFRQVLFGLTLGVGAVLISLQPIMHVNGIQIDPRNLFVGCAAAIIGPIGGIITFLIAAATRYHEAAPSANVCIFSQFVAGCAGLVWRYFTKDIKDKNEGHLAILGLMISMSFLSTFLLPRDDWRGVFTNAVPLLILINIIGAMVLGGFIERQRQQKERELELLDQASFDPLTGLLNRRAFETEYNASILSKPSSGTAFIIVDLDHFKDVNDSFGHPVGDRVLTGVSRILRANTRVGDLSARFGGDEFVICLSDVSFRHTAKIVDRIQKNISNFGAEELGFDASLTASVGACWRETPLSMKAAFDCADRSLYQAKLDGKNQVVFSNMISVTTGPNSHATHLPTA